MKYILDKKEAECIKSLLLAKKEQKSWSDFSLSDEGNQLRLAKAEEQNGFCGYCECLLTNDDRKVFVQRKHLDHFYPRNQGAEARPDLQYDWDNLILSCDKVDSCGKYKDSSNHSILPSQIINPRTENPRDYITFVLDGLNMDCSCWKHVVAVGKPCISISAGQKARDTIEALHLNSDALMCQRMQAIVAELQKIDLYIEFIECADTEKDKEAVRQVLADYEKELEGKEFSSALLSYVHSQWGEL